MATHIEKLGLSALYDVSYQTAKNYRSAIGSVNIHQSIPLPEDASWEKHLEIIQGMDELIAIHQLVPSEITIEIPTKLPIAIVNTADWHLGAFGVDYKSFKADVGLWESEPGVYVAAGGDGYHNIIQASKVGSSHNQAPISVQKGLYVLTLKKLINKILYISTGNHNYWTALADGEDWDKELSNRLKLVYTKHFARINLKVGNMVYPILRLHKGRFNSSFNLTHSAKQYQRMYYPEARIIVVEHQHLGAIEQYRYNDNECVAIRTGTYDVYDDYAQQNGFFGSHVCNPTVVLYPDEDRVIGFKDMREAVIYLRAVRNDKR
jgi:hypothetical protein